MAEAKLLQSGGAVLGNHPGSAAPAQRKFGPLLDSRAQTWPFRVMATATKTMIFRTRVDARRKAGADRVLSRLGISAGQLVNMVFAQVELKNGIPFPLTAVATDDGQLPHVPNAATAVALRAPAITRVKSLRALRTALRAKD